MRASEKHCFFFLIIAVLMTSLIFYAGAFAEQAAAFVSAPDTVRPGKTDRYVISLPENGSWECILEDASGRSLGSICRETGVAGENAFLWDGLLEDGSEPAPGEYSVKTVWNGTESEMRITVGEPAPRLTGVQAEADAETGTVTVTADCSCSGTFFAAADTDEGTVTVMEKPALKGENAFVWNGTVNGRRITAGENHLRLWLEDDTGYAGTKQNITFEYPLLPDLPDETEDGENTVTAGEVEADTDEAVQTAEEAGETAVEAGEDSEEDAPDPDDHTVIPSKVTTAEDEFNYWTLPIGVLDEEKIWEVMMQPMTVIDGGQKDTYKLRATPDSSTKKSNIVGEITCASQGVHVLETLDNGWTLIEAYNSSYGPKCTSRRGYGVTNELITGYVKTSLLKTYDPQDYMGLLIDKKNQTMYIFEDGKITGTLLVSTGLNNKTQSWNETPSGEYVMISKMGGFPAGNLWCAYGMRVNGGCAIHEVPYIGNKDTPAARRDYSSSVKLLGQKASHGCIRVQKAANESGQNIKWLWDHMKVGVKVLIWEDSGRFTEYPDNDMPLYYNPTGGTMYHDDQNCKGVKARWLPLKEFTYGQLEEEPFASLTLCPTCGKTLRKSEIDALNRENGF